MTNTNSPTGGSQTYLWCQISKTVKNVHKADTPHTKTVVKHFIIILCHLRIFTYIHTLAVTFNLIHLCYYVATYSAPMSSHHTNHIQKFMLCFPHYKSNGDSSKAKHEEDSFVE